MSNELITVDLTIDPELRDLLPPLTPEEFDMLEDSISTNGIMEKIRVWINPEDEKLYVIDGHNRQSICKKYNIPITFDNVLAMKFNPNTKDKVIEWMIMNQLERRNLTFVQKYEIIQKHKELFIIHGKENMSAGGKGSTTLPKVDTRKEMAKMVGVSEGTYSKLDKIMKSDNEEIKKKVRTKEVTINKAYEEIKPKQEINKQEPEKPEIRTTNDCDMLIDDIDKKIEDLIEHKAELYIIRQQKFDEAPEELRCEVEEKYDNTRLFNHNFYFYFVKGDNRKLVFEISDYAIKNNKDINDFLQYKKFTKDEKAILLSKIFETQKKWIAEEILIKEQKKQKSEKIYEEFNKASNEYSEACNELSESLKVYTYFSALKSTQATIDIVKEIFNQGYKALAKKNHPDISKDDGKQMQLINQVKDVLDKLIAS